MSVGCIASRKWTPSTPQGQLLTGVGFYLATIKQNVVSGNAEGGDYSYATGVNKKDPRRLRVYQPWPKFNELQIQLGNDVREIPDQYVSTDASEYVTLMNDTAFAWSQYAELKGMGNDSFLSLKQGTQKLMMRNVLIVKDVDYVVAAPELDARGNPAGGTAFGIFLAGIYGKPIQVVDVTKVYPAWDICQQCRLPTGFWTCGARIHSLKPYAS